MNLDKLITMAKKYEDALHEHTEINHSAPANTNVDICSHLHGEVSELFNVIRRKKAEHDGMTYEEGILDELQDILCIWALAVNLLAPNANIDKMIDNCTNLFKVVALKKKGVDIGAISPSEETVIAKVDELPWEKSEHEVEGLNFKWLYKNEQNGLVTWFNLGKEEVAYPPFILNGYAHYFVIDGILSMVGKEHPKGTFIHCDDGTIIDPIAKQSPCVVLCIYEKNTYWKD